MMSSCLFGDAIFTLPSHYQLNSTLMKYIQKASRLIVDGNTADLKDAMEFCPGCTLLVYNTYDETHTINEYYYQVPKGHCADSFSTRKHHWYSDKSRYYSMQIIFISPVNLLLMTRILGINWQPRRQLH